MKNLPKQTKNLQKIHKNYITNLCVLKLQYERSKKQSKMCEKKTQQIKSRFKEKRFLNFLIKKEAPLFWTTITI